MPSESSFLEWLEAADILMVRDSEIRAAGWPSAFSLNDLAYLQYPDTTANDFRLRIKQQDARDRLIEAMKASIATGALKAETCRKEIKKAAFQAPQPSAGLGSVAWQSRDFDRQDEQRAARARYDAQPDVTIVADEVVTREAFAAWGGLPDQKQSEHVRAWIRPLGRAEEAHQGSVEANKVKRKTKGDLVEDWIRECERRAKDIGELFDRAKMPGTKAEFLELLKALDREFENMNTVSSLETYLDGRYKWSGGRPKSAKPLYARLFPESRILNPGVVLPLQMKP
ncbi:hypothetical protein [Zoogloea dura]|uniref:Uncharacterized protein n=1 Tax=Zoogloea dura TaxID=2728840 RepID=A0A848FXI9_9RHOO|nr:hypothetical protein [Zoogloea dura]NML24588.1 hypothetical protein [Zoogloea dura]